MLPPSLNGKAAVRITGLGAATADTIYGCIAALGLNFATQILLEQSEWLHTAGALFLVYLAIRTLKSSIASEEASVREGKGYLRAYTSTLMLTLTNPMTILSFAGLFAGLNIDNGTSSAVWMVVGVCVGSAAWWLLLSQAVGSLRHKVNERAMRTINYVAAFVLLGFGLHALYEALRIGL